MKGAWLIAVGGLIGAAVAAYYYFIPGVNLDGERGVLLVIVSSLLMAASGIALAGRVTGGLASLLVFLVLLDIIGTAVCAYFLETPIILAAMALAALGWVMRAHRPCRRRQRGGDVMKKVLALLAVGAAGLAGAVLLSGGGIAQMAASAGDQVWDAFGGNQQAQKYSTATQITPDNVKNLQKAWEVHTGDVAHGKDETSWGATPLFVNNTVYVGTPKYKIFAVEPDTGKQKWVL